MSRGLDVGFLGSIDPQSGGTSAPSRPRLIARRFFYASATDIVPAGARRAVMKAVGTGGGYSGFGSDDRNQGGGGAFASDETACSTDQTATVTVGTAPQSANGADTVISLNGTTVRAAGGKSGANGRQGGQAADCIGKVKRSGGNGGILNPSSGSSSPGTAGEGGAPTPNGQGGGSAGDVGDADAHGFGERGGSGNSCGYGGGARGGGDNTGFSNNTGKAMIEYWSA